MVQILASLLKVSLAVGLIVAWGFVLLPPLTRFISSLTRSHDTIGVFRSNMMVLGDAGTGRNRGNSSAANRSAHRSYNSKIGYVRVDAKRRRREIIAVLAGLTVVTFTFGLFIGGAAWMLFVFSAGMLGVYTFLLRVRYQMRQERRSKVAYLPLAADTSETEDVLWPVSTANR